MPLIWAAISAHGFGHAAQVVPVLNALGKRVRGLRVLLRTTVPASFFEDRLSIPWERSPVQQDVGCLQNGPLSIDVEATWLEHDRFHETWADRLEEETRAMGLARPDLVLADTPYLALAAGKRAGIPAIALASLTWDLVLRDYQAPSSIDKPALLQFIQQAYAEAACGLRITPAPPMRFCDDMTDIGPIAEPVASARTELAETLHLAPEEKTVLVGFGGIPLETLPFDQLEHLHGYRFLFDGPLPHGQSLFVSSRSLPFSFKTLMASVDVILTKPGYGTLVEAVVLDTPLIYVRRHNFADEQPLVDYLHRYGRGIELSREDFTHGRWQQALEQSLKIPPPAVPPPPLTGADDAARLLATRLL